MNDDPKRNQNNNQDTDDNSNIWTGYMNDEGQAGGQASNDKTQNINDYDQTDDEEENMPR
jgi:hypothetical protein